MMSGVMSLIGPVSVGEFGLLNLVLSKEEQLQLVLTLLMVLLMVLMLGLAGFSILWILQTLQSFLEKMVL